MRRRSSKNSDSASNLAPATAADAGGGIGNHPPVGRQLKYQHIEAEVRKLAAMLPLKAKMPTERELAATYGCSVLTVRKGLKVLVDEGIIRRRTGSGTFIARRSEAPIRTDRLVGFLAHSQSDAYANKLLQTMAQLALDQSILPRSVWIRGFNAEAKAQIEALRREGCTAFTLPWFPLEEELEVRDFLRECGVAISLPQPVPGYENYSFVAPHLFGGPMGALIETLVRYFSLLGNEDIALLGPDMPHNIILQQQLTAYTSAMSRLQRPSLSALVAPKGRSIDDLAQRWSAYRGKLAVITYDDEHAIRFMTAMHKIGLMAPTDYRIVGFNNTEASRFTDPPLSTVAQNFDFIGRWLIRSSLALAAGNVDQAQEVPPCDLVVRSTCGGAGHLDDALISQLPGLTPRLETEPAA
ncbi:MAG TPA: substrate-binding domain-containing protein [Opitutaceae bacterium]|nr:substrate-binding domain-containing protein [Opitutaceae bacterium]